MKKVTKKGKKETKDLLTVMEEIRGDIELAMTVGDEWDENVRLVGKTLTMNEDEVMIVCLMLSKGEEYVNFPSGFASELRMSKIAVLKYEESLTQLVRRGYLFHQEGKLGGDYALTEEAFECLKQGKPYCQNSTDGITADEFYLQLREILANRIAQNMYFPELVRQLKALMEGNPEQEIAKEVGRMELKDEEMVLLAYVCSNYYLSQEETAPTNRTFRSLFGAKRFFKVRATLRNGSNQLIKAELMKHQKEEGNDEDLIIMKLDYLKKVVPTDLKPKKKENDIYSDLFDEAEKKEPILQLIKADKIRAKQLFYSPEVEKQMKTMVNILSGDNLQKVQQRMRDKGLVEGICTIMYGLPGTGKTAGAMELARQTGRDILMVDMSAIRGKFVGESEKNTKRVWTEYQELCEKADKMPILLLNEADALITRRSPGMGAASDKAENVMANICLQAMEEFRGICIATSNLAENMDPAFERRWLMKIRFDKPTTEQCQQVWKSLVPQLAADQVDALTREYDFSPGEIANIARKEEINDILQGDDRDVYASILENCKTERLEQQKQRARVGF